MKQMWKSWTTGAITIMLVLALAACGSNNEPKQGTEPAPAATEQVNPPAEETSVLKTEYPLTVKDATGETLTFKEAPKKIISISPAETESLFALGLDEQIIGVSDYDDYPEAATTKPKMGGLYNPNEEAIIAAQPDLVVTGISMSAEAAQHLRDLGITIFKTDPKTVNDVIANIELFGQISDHQEEAKTVIDKMKQEQNEVTEAVKSLTPEQKKKVYIEFSPGWTVGSGEFMDELITLAGGVNVAADTAGWYEISEEKIIKDNPDVILFSKNVIDDKTQKTLDQMIKARSGWDQITAVKNDAVYGLDDNLVSRPGPRVTEGLKEIAKAIYPELLKP
ncbi:ABC transporter substrate-binding protein [Paenibacillus sp. N3/727]|uniref:ABC transporter substrate-binding protein n=1 Tax=Paenibacillus sp. N3/727 TaxID=2925845 RepID=UPI001F52ED7C|nr:ABC transporter substrate-binding protein [Paenibacillus sp. N3/727]UNK17579.1 ABC transporter substrate-binding protein [Paenibacillus sp. N3/727]